jgi:hypothetical protein
LPIAWEGLEQKFEFRRKGRCKKAVRFIQYKKLDTRQIPFAVTTPQVVNDTPGCGYYNMGMAAQF